MSGAHHRRRHGDGVLALVLRLAEDANVVGQSLERVSPVLAVDATAGARRLGHDRRVVPTELRVGFELPQHVVRCAFDRDLAKHNAWRRGPRANLSEVLLACQTQRLMQRAKSSLSVNQIQCLLQGLKRPPSA
jgi:hypothetical protein